MDIGQSKESFQNDNRIYRQLVLEPQIRATNIVHDIDMIQAYHLRHGVFAEELAWVPCSENGLEADSYDNHAEHFGVFQNKSLLAYLRLVMPTHRFMLEKEFACLVSADHHIRKANDTCEVSRLCVKPDERATKVHTDIGSMGISMFLYRQVYKWCGQFGVRYLYLVVEYKVYRLLSMLGFPCSLVGEPTRMPDGVVAVAAIMDWREFEKRNELNRPKLIDWFNQPQAYQGVLLPQRPEVCLQPQAFS